MFLQTSHVSFTNGCFVAMSPHADLHCGPRLYQRRALLPELRGRIRVGAAGLEPAKPEGATFTEWCNSRYTTHPSDFLFYHKYPYFSITFPYFLLHSAIFW